MALLDLVTYYQKGLDPYGPQWPGPPIHAGWGAEYARAGYGRGRPYSGYGRYGQAEPEKKKRGLFTTKEDMLTGAIVLGTLVILGLAMTR